MALALIKSLSEDLGSPDANARRSAMTELNKQLPEVALTHTELCRVSEFLAARLNDWATVGLASEAVRALMIKYPKSAFSLPPEEEDKLNEDVLSLVPEFEEISHVPKTSTLLDFFLKKTLTTVHAPSFAQTVRMAIYRLLAALGEGVFAEKEQSEKLTEMLVTTALLQAEDERDPRNLLEIWQFLRVLARHVNSRQKQEIFNLVESYFPIHFKANEKHAIDVARLKEAISEVLLEIGEPALSMVLSHLDDADSENVKDACNLLMKFPLTQEIFQRVVSAAFSRAEDSAEEFADLLGKVFFECSEDFFRDCIFAKFDVLRNWPNLKLMLRSVEKFSPRNFQLLVELVGESGDSDALRRVLAAGEKFAIEKSLAEKLVLMNLPNPGIGALLVPHVANSAVIEALLAADSEEISETLIKHHTSRVSEFFFEKFSSLSRRLQVALTAARPRQAWDSLIPAMSPEEAAEFVDERNAEFLGDRVPLQGVFVEKLLSFAKDKACIVRGVLLEILSSESPVNLPFILPMAASFDLTFRDWLRLLKMAQDSDSLKTLLIHAPVPVIEKFAEQSSGLALARALTALMSRDSPAAVRVMSQEGLMLSPEVSLRLEAVDAVREEVGEQLEDDRKFLAVLSGLQRLPKSPSSRLRRAVIEGLDIGSIAAVVLTGKALKQTSPLIEGDLKVIITRLVELVTVDLCDVCPLVVLAALQALEVASARLAFGVLVEFRTEVFRRCRRISGTDSAVLRRAAAAVYSAWLCLEEDDEGGDERETEDYDEGSSCGGQ